LRVEVLLCSLHLREHETSSFKLHHTARMFFIFILLRSLLQHKPSVNLAPRLAPFEASSAE